MTCKETEKLIPLFIKKELSYVQLEKFMDHIANCPNCMEEVSIQFLIEKGMLRLKDGDTFDLNEELQTLLEDSKTKLKMHKGMQYFIVGLEIGLLFLIIAVILIIIL